MVVETQQRKRRKKYTYEEVKKHIESNSDSKLISDEYKNGRTKLKLLCSCSDTFEVCFENILYKGKLMCNKCTASKGQDSKRIKIEHVEEYCSKLGIKVLSDTVKSVKDKLLFQCSCGNEFERAFNNLKSLGQHLCKECALKSRAEKRRYDLDYIKDFMSENNCTLLSTSYSNRTDMLEILCSCGNKFSTTFGHFKTQNKRQCNDCSQKFRYTQSQVEKEIEDSNCTLLSEFTSVKDKLKIRCSCGKVFNRSLDNFRKKLKQCPSCSKMYSKGIIAITNFIKEKELLYELEYKFEDLISDLGNPLRFDIRLELNGENVLIEYDGEFHFKKFYEDQDIERQNIHDRMKDEYCRKNNIRLLRIPFWEYKNINNIMSELVETS